MPFNGLNVIMAEVYRSQENKKFQQLESMHSLVVSRTNEFWSTNDFDTQRLSLSAQRCNTTFGIRVLSYLDRFGKLRKANSRIENQSNLT